VKKILITGASTGIGKAIALSLDRQGWQVFAGVRNQKDKKNLQAKGSDHLQPVILDITKEAHIKKIVETVGSSLDGLINNAGIVCPGPLELMPIEDAKRQLDVNVISQISVTQAFLPAIRKAQGRIVFISSVSGMIVFPLLGMYAASKHALEAIGDGFRRELKKWDIKVSIIEPGSMKTPIWNKTLNRGNSQMKKLPKEKLELYEDEINSLLNGASEAEKKALDAKYVVDAVIDALEASKPKTRYIVGPIHKLKTIIARFLPDSFLDDRF
jgi:NAD(P)-dependent dehydrogenase (short-subunit alcohol dehydrogenase family)